MEYIIFCICSIIVARYVEKKSRIISIAHDILFILLSFAFFFATNNKYIVDVVMKVVGKDIYTTIHEAITASSTYIRFGFSTLFIIEFTILFIVALAAIIIFIKSLKETAKKIRVKTLNDIKLVVMTLKKEDNPTKESVQYSQNKYLLNCKFNN